MSGNGNEIYEQFARIEWLLRRRQSQGRRSPMSDPHRGQGRVLALLKLKMEISQKELSAILDIRSQSLGELLAKLEHKGYITRTPSEADRRVMDIQLTDAGKTAAEQEEPVDNDIFACLNEDEQGTLIDYLSRIIEGLEQYAHDGDHRHRRRTDGVSIDINLPPFLSGKHPFIHIKHSDFDDNDD